MQEIRLPFAQQEKHACAPICISIAAMFLLNGEEVLHGPWVDENKLHQAFKRGIAWWEFNLEERRQKTPNDRSTHFAVDDVVSVYARTHAPCYTFRHAQGFVATRTLVHGSSEIGLTPRLLDELDDAFSTGVPHALILTCDTYTRLVFMRSDGLWLYDSHGDRCSILFSFPSLDHLLVMLLRKCGITDESQLQENLAQLHDPHLRMIDADFDPTKAPTREYELTIMTLGPTKV